MADASRRHRARRTSSLKFGGKAALKDVSLRGAAGTRTAVIGPTAAGKTQLLYLLTGLLAPTSGRVEYDGHGIDEYDKDSLHQQVGFVFQDSDMFNLTLRENIAFSKTVKDEDLEKAIVTAELKDFIDALAAGARHGRLRARHEPVGRPEAAHHAGARAGAQSARAAARRLHGARRHGDRAEDSRERAARTIRASRCCR